MTQFSWLSKLMFNTKHSDMFVLSEKEDGKVRFPAHRNILSAQSKVLDAMLTEGNFVEGRTREVKIFGFSAIVVAEFLKFFYTNAVSDVLSFDQLHSLLKIAHLYEVTELVQTCSSKMSKTVKLKDVCEVFESAKSRNLNDLTESCRSTIKSYWFKITRNDLHFALELDSYKSFLEDLPKGDSAGELANKRGFKRWLNWVKCAQGIVIQNTDEVWFKRFSSEDTISPYAVQQSCQWICDLYLNPFQSDMEVVIEGNAVSNFPVHSLVLMTRCGIKPNIAKKRSPKSSRLSRITLKPVETRVVEYFLRFLYTNWFPTEISEKNALELHNLSREYDVKELEKLCLAELSSSNKSIVSNTTKKS